MTPTPTSTFRLSNRDRRTLERLATELVCKRTDVLRFALDALESDHDRRRQIAAENLARNFLQSLRNSYGENAVLELVDADPTQRQNWRLANEPLDPDIDVATSRQGDEWILDLIDRSTGVAIKRAMAWDHWEDNDGRRHAVVPLRDLWVYASAGTAGDTYARELIDGRTVVQIEEDDGSISAYAIDGHGQSVRLEGADLMAAGLRDVKPSVGVGVRRESRFGPHVGPGYGGSYALEGDVELDRARLVAMIEDLLVKARNGELDGILAGAPKVSV